MKRMVAGFLTSVVLALPFSAQGANIPDFESQIGQVQESVRSSRALKALRQRPKSRPSPKKNERDLSEVYMEIKQTAIDDIDVRETSWDIWLWGYLTYGHDISFGNMDAVAGPTDCQDTFPYYYHLNGRDIRMGILRFDDMEDEPDRRYEIVGHYKRTEGGEDIFMYLTLPIQENGQWHLVEDGVELWIDPQGLDENPEPVSRTIIYGKVDKKKFGRTELIILGACVAAMTHIPYDNWPDPCLSPTAGSLPNR